MYKEPKFELHFENEEAPELVKTVFSGPGYDRPVLGLRACFAPKGTISFRWQMNTHAMAVLFVKAAAQAGESFEQPIVSGDHHSLAGRLGNMFRKQKYTTAFLDLVGSDSNGRSNLSRMIMILNYNRRRPGPISVYYRPNYLEPSHITVLCNGKVLSGPNLRAFAKRLELTWVSYEVRRGKRSTIAPALVLAELTREAA